MLVTNRIDSSIGYVLYLLLGMLSLIAERNGEQKYHRGKVKNELHKMKTLNMK
ncbi:hypothetical protein GCM10008986_31600 [Salinibacillus aidingensis]|uniref:Uncharacterized protein n=1 Tax=Salinibacillus aidingensis TaxID=237684 RepID=A0ABP3LIW1_9BACI